MPTVLERQFHSPEHLDTPEYDIPEELVLDFDRMLGDVSACMTRFYTAAELAGFEVDGIKEARKVTEDDGGTFEPLSYIKERLDETSYEIFCKDFIFQPGPDVLYPDAQRFLSILQYADVPHTIMTYGVNPEWQRLKLKASGYPMGCTITDNPDKSAGLQALRSTTPTGEPGTFNMQIAAYGRANYRAESLIFIDDKAKAFANFPQDPQYRGFWLQRGGLLPSQEGSVPSNVATIHSLDELMVTEEGRLILGEVPKMPPYPSRKTRWMLSPYDQYLYQPVYASMATYLPVQEGLVVHDDCFTNYDSFWTVPQYEYSLAGKLAAANAVHLDTN